MRRLVPFSLVIILATSVLPAVFFARVVKAETIIVPDDYSTIQEAINHANGGETIFVRSGIYFENVVVDEGLSLVGQGRASTFIDGGGDGNVTTIASDGVSMSGFTIRNSGGYPNGGIIVRYVDGCSVHDNAVTGNYYGVEVLFSSHVILDQNDISLNDYSGAWIHQSSFNTLLHNNLTENHSEGIRFSHSVNDTFLGNCVTANGYNGVGAYNITNCRLCNNTLCANDDCGFQLLHCANSDVISNVIMDNDGYGIDLLESPDNVLSGNTIINDTVAGINVWRSARSGVISNVVAECPSGVMLWDSVGSTVKQNTITLCTFDGIRLFNSSRNTIILNEVANNTDGIQLSLSCLYNVIFHNNFAFNLHQSFASLCNIWDNGYPNGGNFWSDYAGLDTHRGAQQDQLGGDGIGDVSYVIGENNTDRYPLMKRWLMETIKGDINHDGGVTIFDIVAATSIYGSKDGDLNWNPEADLAPPYGRIDIYDLLTCVSHYGKKRP